MDRPEVVLAKVNAFNLSDVSVSQILAFSSSLVNTDVKEVNLSIGSIFLLLLSLSTKNHLTWRRVTTLDLKIHHSWLTLEMLQR